MMRVEPADAGLRLDRFLSLRWQGENGAVTRGEAQRWIEAGCVLVEGRPAKVAQKLAAGASVEVEPPPRVATEALPDDSITFPVLHEDEWLLVLEKPSGLVVHPARGHESGTLVNGLLAREGFDLDDEGETQARPGIVHRLDKGTSGVMVVAKHEGAREGLKRLFERHDIERSYLAITVGLPQPGRLDTLHGRHPTDRLRFSTRVSQGKRAITLVDLIEPLAGGAAALVRCTLETGRTHQIRVHLAEILGTPVLGDPIYGKPPRDLGLRALGEQLGHQALHAAVLGFVHPMTGERLRFEAPLPADVAATLEQLRARLKGPSRRCTCW
jgi:23S rRNA pseudouridine1911/1915/1917 synthase